MLLVLSRYFSRLYVDWSSNDSVYGMKHTTGMTLASIADQNSEGAPGSLGAGYGVAILIGVGTTVDVERPTAMCCGADAAKNGDLPAQPYFKSMM
jgi:hypothetical protein